MADDIAWLDATAQAALVRRGELSARELVDAAIARVERLNPQLNAVILPLFDKARQQAAGPLPPGPFAGVPFLLKDLDVASAGDPLHCGMKFLRDLRWVADQDSHLVAKFREAGFICVGKTNTPELGLSVTTEPAAYGPSRNPWNVAHSTGGSSGGSAAAVAAGMVPAAHASDGGGSIRIPASECGLVGLKPSRGRVSLGPEHGEYWNGLVISHVVTRSVRDTAAILDAVSSPMPGDPYFAPPPSRPFLSEVGAPVGRLRIGLVDANVDPACAAAVAAAGRLLASLGHDVEAAAPAPLANQSETLTNFSTLVAAWVALSLTQWERQTGGTITPADVEPSTWALAELGRGIGAAQYLDAEDWMYTYTRRMASWWSNGFDVLVTPTIGVPPPLIGELSASAGDPQAGTSKILAIIPYTVPFNITGQPAMSLPLHWSDTGLPIGLQFVGAYGREDVLIRLAAQLEQAQPWSGKRPTVHA